MARLLRRPREFNPAVPVYVRGHGFTAAGQDYKRGEEFPWRSLGISHVRVARLYATGKLTHHTMDQLAAPAAEVEPETEAETEAEAEPCDGLDDLSLADLQGQCEARGLPTYGTKQTLKDRLQA